MKNKIQIFIFRSRNQQFVQWGQKEQQWCEKYRDYFTILDDGEGQIEHNLFKVVKISDFKNPLYLDNKTLHQGVGLLNIANNLDQFNYQYIGFVHMDMFPFYFNHKYLETKYECGYPIQQCQLFNLDMVFQMLRDNNFFSFSLLSAIQTWMWHLQDFKVIIDNRYTIWEWLAKRFSLFDCTKLSQKERNNLKLSIACSFLAKKECWKKLQLFINNFDQLNNLEKYNHQVDCVCNKDVITSQILQAFIELIILDYIKENNVNFNLIPICHFN